MRVTRFSIGFGPTLWKHTPEGSPTTYQIGIIPFLAYVQIAGMNPLEENDPADRGSYANASVFGRISTIFAGPFANYLFASVLFFASLILGGREVLTTKVTVSPTGAAAAAQMKDGDKIVAIAGEPVKDWEHTRSLISAHPNEVIDIAVEREGKPMHLDVKPTPTGDNGSGRIGVAARADMLPVGVKEATVLSVKLPAQVVVGVVAGLGRLITGKEKPEFSGPVGIVRETAKAVRSGIPAALGFLGLLSAYLGAFNLIPFPALDGGRLVFLAYEATTRRKFNAKVETWVHVVGIVMLVALLLVVTAGDIMGRGH
jgi:regulator of sigma E protease